MRQGLKWQITWARMPGCQNNIYLLFVTCVSISKARLSDLFGIRALFIFTFPPEKKKKKRSDFMETEGNEAFTWGQPEKDKLTQVSDSMQCSIFNKQALSISSQRVLWPCWIFNAEEGWRDRDTFPNRVGDRQKKKSGREGEKENTSCMSPLLIPTSQTQNQTWWLSEWSWAPLWNACAERKFLVCLSNALPSHKKRQLLCDKVSWIFLSELDSSASNALHYFLTCSAPVISSSWKLFVK